MLVLAIVLPVVLLVVIPGFLLLLGLAKTAGKRTPRPGDAERLRRPVPHRKIVAQTQAARYCEMMRRRLREAEL